VYKNASQRLQKQRERGARAAPRGSAEWMRRQQAKRLHTRETAAQRDLRQRLDTEARNQAQRAVNREGPPSQDARTVKLPPLAGLHRPPTTKRPPAS